MKRIARWNECQRWLTDKQLANGNAGALPARSTRGAGKMQDAWSSDQTTTIHKTNLLPIRRYDED